MLKKLTCQTVTRQQPLTIFHRSVCKLDQINLEVFYYLLSHTHVCLVGYLQQHEMDRITLQKTTYKILMVM